MARLLVLSNHFPPHGYGGYEFACADAVRRWRSHGHEVAVLTADHYRDGAGEDSGEDSGEEADQGGPVWRTLPLTWKVGTPPSKWKRVAVERHAQQVLATAIDGWAPDAISVWNMAGLPLSLLYELLERDIAKVAVLADEWPVFAPAEDPWFRPLLLHPRLGGVIAALARRPARVPDLDALGLFVFASDALRRRCRDGSQWAFPKSEIVPLGVTLAEFPLVAATAKPWSGRLLYVGRLDPNKGVDTAVRALASLPHATLDILGPAEPAHLERVERVIAAAGVGARVRIGSAPRAALAERYRAADILVFPSEWEEPFGIVPLEAMASGAVVVATGTGGAAEFLVDGENCVLFPPGDAVALAAAIERAAADAALRQRLVEGGLATAARLTTDHMADRLEALHLRAAAGHSNTVR